MNLYGKTSWQEILIVDDSPTIISILRKSLEPEGYKIKTASSGEEALKIIFTSLPDLILLDVTMPGIDGYETCKIIKSNNLTSGIPIIFVTSSDDSENKVKGFEVGAVDYLTKPFSSREILARVKTHLQLRGLVQQHERLIMDLRQMNEQLEVLSKTDTLTQLANRRAMLDHLESERSRHERTLQPFSLILADIDHFKKFNDTFGHEIGDFVLKEVAHILNDNTRKQDVVSRWGGEEFLILLPDTTLSGAVELAQILLKKVSSSSFNFEEHELKVTLSFGVADFNKGQSVDDCIKVADTRLYKAKENGRNQVVSDNS